MSVLQKEIGLAGSKGRATAEALFDSGASYSCITPALARKLAHVEKLPEPFRFMTAKNGDTLEATECVRLDFHYKGFRLSDEFIVVPDLSEAVIIGAATLQKWRIKLDFENDDVIIDPRAAKLRIPFARPK